MKRTEKEWRVVSTRKFGTFKCFETLESVEVFLGLRPHHKDQDGNDVYSRGSLASDPHGPYRFEERFVGGTKDDWKEIPLSGKAVV